MTPDAAVSIGTILAVVLAAVLKVLFDRRDKRKAAEREITTIPDNPVELARFRQRMRDKAKGNVQS